jgi:hypothetical protein
VYIPTCNSVTSAEQVGHFPILEGKTSFCGVGGVFSFSERGCNGYAHRNLNVSQMILRARNEIYQTVSLINKIHTSHSFSHMVLNFTSNQFDGNRDGAGVVIFRYALQYLKLLILN